MSINKPVFIYSLHRSGSTYLKNIIDKSDEVKMLEDEVHLNHPVFTNTFHDLYKKYCNHDFAQYDDFLHYLDSNSIRGTYWDIYKKKFSSFKNSKKFLEGQPTLYGSFNSILRQVLNRSSKPRIGIKYPTHFYYFEEFREAYPDAKNIFLVRDLRAIVASKLVSPTNERLNESNRFKYEAMRLFILIYFSIEYLFFLRKLKKHKNTGLVITYRDLVLHKEKTVKRVCKYCELALTDVLFHADGKSSGYKKAKSPHDRLNRWTKVLRSYEIHMLNFVTCNQRAIDEYEG